MLSPSEYVESIYEYEANDESELSLAVGAKFELIEKTDSEWWKGRDVDSGETGYFPSAYVRSIDYKESAGQPQPLQQTPPRSTPTQVPAAAVSVAQVALDAVPTTRAPHKTLDMFEDVVESESRFGMMATNMAIGSGITSSASGLALLIILLLQSADGDVKLEFDKLVLSLYCIVIGIVVVWFEYSWVFRSGTTIPIRAVCYVLIGLPAVFTPLLLVSALAFFLTAAVNGVSAWLGEVFVRPPSGGSAAGPAKPASRRKGLQHFVSSFFTRAREQNQIGSFVFLFFVVAVNIFVAVNSLLSWIDFIHSLPPTLALSPVVPYAKMFGNLLDLNCGIILLPVCRTFIRYLYDLSTQSQARSQLCMRALLKFVPLDKSLTLHRRIGWWLLYCTYGHVFFHLVNWGLARDNSLARFGLWPWISGVVILVCMLFMYGAVTPAVKRTQFELFWYSHQLFIIFFIFLLTHGAGGFNPNVWKWLLVPGAIYIAERVYRRYSAYRSVELTSINVMHNVLCIEFQRDSAFPNGYKEGQYLFLNCPHISYGQWHPFTISSAPQEESVSLHMRVMGPSSWTGKLCAYLQLMLPSGASYTTFVNASQKGKVIGPDGRALLRVYGPHSAPTQHIASYSVDMIIGAGIGVTPVSATLRSIVHHRWKYSVGKSFPDHAYFYFVCAHREINSFRWFIRVLKDADDAIHDACAKKTEEMKRKTFEFHVFVTSVPTAPRAVDRVSIAKADDSEFWGHSKLRESQLETVSAPWSEIDMLEAMTDPPDAGTRLGSVRVYKGRPRWDARFAEVAARHSASKTGVAFCGNPKIGHDLQSFCTKYSDAKSGKFFVLHKENFE